MSNRTAFSHSKCDGDIVLDLSPEVKLIAPAFSITPDGIQSVVIDVRDQSSGVVAPHWSCIKCNRDVDVTELSCKCSVCGEKRTVQEMKTSTRVTFICETCIKRLKSGELKNLTELFGLTGRSRFFDLSEILKKPVNL